MSKSRPRLITFAISHYCEKARWALDWHGIDYVEEGWAPGVHRFMAKRAGAKRGSVPMLFAGDRLIEGSNAIIDWSEENSASGRSHLGDGNAEELEKRLDKKIGVNVRRFIYSHVFPHNAHLVKPLLFANTGAGQRLAANIMWPMTKKLISKAYRLDADAGAESKSILEAEFDWLDDLVETGKGYLVGSSFGRADLTAASLLAPIARPKEMSTYATADYPDEVASTFRDWSDRTSIEWSRQIYARHRMGQAA